MTSELELDLLGDPADDVLRTADISPDGVYRYTLNRTWGHAKIPHRLPWIMLNPSTADHQVDDPTIRRCMGFARTWGFSGITVANLYAYRATNPADLWKAADPVGPRNDRVLRQLLVYAAGHGLPAIAAWGANARPDRVATVRAMPGAEQIHHLGVTNSGAPRHPLYLRKTAMPTPWRGDPR